MTAAQLAALARELGVRISARMAGRGIRYTLRGGSYDGRVLLSGAMVGTLSPLTGHGRAVRGDTLTLYIIGG